MPRLKNKIPAYRKHKASGRAVVTLDDWDFYLGESGSLESRREYERVVAERLSAGRSTPGSRFGHGP